MEFEIDLAFTDGKLTGKGKTRLQRWALGYHVFMEKRDKSEDQFEIIKLLHYLLRVKDQKFYDEVFPSSMPADPDAIPGQTYTVDQLEEMEQRVKEMMARKNVSQSRLNRAEWTDWG